MARMTAKYKAAIDTAVMNRIDASGFQEDLYLRLESNWFFWDSKAKAWNKGEAPKPASPLVRVRVWADLETVERQAGLVVDRLTADKFTLVEQSRVYVNRPPQQLEGRVYLTFLQDGGVTV